MSIQIKASGLLYETVKSSLKNGNSYMISVAVICDDHGNVCDTTTIFVIRDELRNQIQDPYNVNTTHEYLLHVSEDFQSIAHSKSLYASLIETVAMFKRYHVKFCSFYCVHDTKTEIVQSFSDALAEINRDDNRKNAYHFIGTSLDDELYKIN